MGSLKIQANVDNFWDNINPHEETCAQAFFEHSISAEAPSGEVPKSENDANHWSWHEVPARPDQTNDFII